MRKLLTVILLLTCLICQAQEYGKMSRFIRELAREQQAAASKGLGHNGATAVNSVVTFVKAPEEAVSQYCIRHQGDIHICHVPLSELAALSEDYRVVRIAARQSNATAHLEHSASIVNVEDAWQGTLLPQAFLGKGTLVGVLDVGIEYLHPTFRSTEDGRLRIVRAWDMIDIPKGQSVNFMSHLISKFPIGTFMNNEESIVKKGGSIDCDILFHGTHTTSTAAGSGYDTPYRGMAPEADIYSVCISLSNNNEKVPMEYRKYYTDAMEMLAYQNIFDYADSIGKPCVISCSFGGAQDITDDDKSKNEYFERMTGPGHIIVASAGNDGSQAGYMPKGSTTSSIGGRISCTRESFTVNVSTPGKLKMHVTDYAKGIETRHTYDLDFLPGNTQKTSTSGLLWYEHFCDTIINDKDTLVTKIYSGNNEFDPTHVGYDIFFYCKDKKFNDHKYVVEFEGEGVAAEIFCQGGSLLPATSYSPTLTGAQPNSGNIGSPGALPSTICVGSITHSNSWMDYKGVNHPWSGGSIGKVAYYSSRGPAQHCFIKPEVMAPGNLITAGMTREILEKDPAENESHVVAFSEYGGKKYPWAVDSGTSMATPVVAGIIALWLEADPTLTKDKIMEVIANTSRQPDATLSYPNTTYGYGEIDAYKGLLYILNPTGITGLSPTLAKDICAAPSADGTAIVFRLKQPSAAALPLHFYAVSGMPLLTSEIPAGTTEWSVPASGMHGIVAVQIGSNGSTLVRMK